jgi:hypothetical protein
MADKRGQAEIKTKYPLDSLDREQANLTPTGINGIKTLVLKKNRKGLEVTE